MCMCHMIKREILERNYNRLSYHFPRIFNINLNQLWTLLVGTARSLLKISSISALLGASAIFDVSSTCVTTKLWDAWRKAKVGRSALKSLELDDMIKIWFFTGKKEGTQEMSVMKCNKKHTRKKCNISSIHVKSLDVGSHLIKAPVHRTQKLASI